MKKSLCAAAGLAAALLLGACGSGGEDSAHGDARQALASPRRLESTVSALPADELAVLGLYQALYGQAPGYGQLTTLRKQWLADSAGVDRTLAADFAAVGDASFARQVLNNMSVTSSTVNAATDDALSKALAQIFAAYGPAARGAVVANLAGILSELAADPVYGAAATAFNTQLLANHAYSSTPSNSVAAVVDTGSHLQVMRSPAQAVADPGLTVQDLAGAYQDLTQAGNTWWAGSIALAPGSSTVLQWTNKAGVVFTLTPTSATNVWAVDARNAQANAPNGSSFDFDVQAGKVVGVSFMGTYMTRASANVTTQMTSATSYLTLDIDKTAVPAGSSYGYSMYTAIWPLVDQPLMGLSLGTAGTWVNPDNLDYPQALVPADHPFRAIAGDMAPYWRGFQTIEGSAGYWWRNSRFPSTQPKYRINGTPNGYSDQLSAPGWEFGGNAIAPGAGGKWSLPMGSAGVAQLSNRLLVPPDGLTFKRGTAGEFLGIAWMALPLTPARGGSNPVGNQSWTFFVNATNYQGPVAFYVPDVWEVLASTYAPAVGRGLDARPGVFAGGFAMEWGEVPLLRGTDSKGQLFGRLPRLSFPTDAQGVTYLASDFSFYSQAAIFGPMQAWLGGGAPVSGQFAAAGTVKLKVSAQTLYMWSGSGATRVQMQSSEGLADYVAPTVVATPKGGSAWALQWKGSAANGTYPEYYQNSNGYMRPVPATQVPDETGLKAASFPFYTDVQAVGTAYTSPTSWRSPAAAAGPFDVQLVDGSTITYAWYRFVDQPALQGFGWTAEQKSSLQAVVEKLHAQWRGQTQFMAPQTVGELASLDAALVVVPPAGLEVGYVPVVISQRR